MHPHFNEVVAKAERRQMCRLVRGGLRRNFADRERGEGSRTALHHHLISWKQRSILDTSVMIKPCVLRGKDFGNAPVIKIYILLAAACLLNWWPRNGQCAHTLY